MDLKEMVDLSTGASNINNAAGSLGYAAGAGIGMAFGVPPMVGGAVGSAVASAATAFIPQYSHVKGSVSGVNFVRMGIKPFALKRAVPDDATARRISDWYCYYGCKTQRNEPLSIPLYMYNNHAYVKGELQYNGSIPGDKFAQINNIFKAGVHILGS